MKKFYFPLFIALLFSSQAFANKIQAFAGVYTGPSAYIYTVIKYRTGESRIYSNISVVMSRKGRFSGTATAYYTSGAQRTLRVSGFVEKAKRHGRNVKARTTLKLSDGMTFTGDALASSSGRHLNYYKIKNVQYVTGSGFLQLVSSGTN